MTNWAFTPGANLAALVRAPLAEAIKVTADEIERDAVQTAPYRSGALAQSSYTKAHDGGLTAEIGFTDSKATAAHENMHDHLRNGRRPKFLELSVQESADVLNHRAQAALRSVFR
jgi:hypothetical protein